MYSPYVKAKRILKVLTNLLWNKKAMLVGILFFFSLIAILGVQLIQNWTILVANVDDYVGAEILVYILALKFNINHLHLTISALTHNPSIQHAHFINVMKTMPGMLWLQYVFLYNYSLQCFQALKLCIVLPLVFACVWVEIELDAIKWLIAIDAFNFSDDYVTNLIDVFRLLKTFSFVIITDLSFFFFAIFAYVSDFFLSSTFFYIIKFIFLQVWSFIQLVPVKDFFLFSINFVKYSLYVVLVNFTYLYEAILFLKLCAISFGWKLFVAWLVSLKVGIFAFFDSVIPKPLARFWLNVVYTPIMATYYFFNFFWVRYISIGVEYARLTLVDPFGMFNEFMLYFTTDVKPTPPNHDVPNPKYNRFYKSYRFFLAQMPAREISRNVWFVYPFIFLYTLFNSTAEWIYESCVEVQDYFFDIYENYLINYGLLYQIFDDYFFNTFLFYFFLMIGSALEAPIYMVDYFMAKPDTDFAGHPYVYFDWFSASETIFNRWVYFKSNPLQTFYLIFLSLLMDLIPVYKIILTSYYNTVAYNEFIAFYDFYFNSNFFFWFRSAVTQMFEYIVALTFQIFFIFRSILNFIVKSLQIHLFFFPMGLIMVLFSIPKTLFYFGFYVNPIVFIQNFLNEFSAFYFILKYFLRNAVQQEWFFVDIYLSSATFSLNYFSKFFLVLFNNLYFMILKFMPILIFELFKFVNLFLIGPFLTLLSLLLSSLVLTNVEYFSSVVVNANSIASKFSMLGFIPIVYINIYFLILSVLILCLYMFLFKKFFQMIVYFRLAGVLMEIQTLMNIFDNSSVGRLYYIMHFDEVQIKQTTTALAKERKPRKVVKLFYRKWFGAGHNHFIDYRWRILQSNFWGWRRFKMQYFLKKNRFRKPLRTNMFFYNTLDYIKHIRMLFFRFYYSAIRVYDLNKFYYISQFNYERSGSGLEYLQGMGRFRPLYGSLIKPIPKYWFPIFSYIPIFFGRTYTKKFSVRTRFIAFKYIFTYGFPSYLVVSNLLWWFYFVIIYSLSLLFQVGARILVFLGKCFFNFLRKK